MEYALVILSRFRSERATKDGPDAAGMAGGTAGSSVVFAGATVFIALFALVVANIGFLTAMGLAAAATVAISVIVALTLIPALLGLFGNKAFAGRIPGSRAIVAAERSGEALSTGRNPRNSRARWAFLTMLIMPIRLRSVVASACSRRWEIAGCAWSARCRAWSWPLWC